MAGDRILVVDDEPSLRTVLSAHLARLGVDVDTAPDGAAALIALRRVPYAVVVSDVRMPCLDGLGLLQWVQHNRPGVPVILVTAYATVSTAVEAMQAGAFDYVAKPFDVENLHMVVRKALTVGAHNRRRLQSNAPETGLIGTAPALRRVHELVARVGPSPSTVLIRGETGTGKELVARALHAASPRRSGPFVVVNCGAIPEGLFESELFGHERGAFTGAIQGRPGRFELAQGGSLFLDEVGELPKEVQVKLLRALQERRIDRVGGVKPVDVDVRVIAATHRDLGAAVAAGQFREDLYYRLNVVPIAMPPLRERPDDLPMLIDHFLERFAERLGRRLHGVTRDAMLVLRAHTWPGNVRELENLVERCVLLADGDEISVCDLGLVEEGWVGESSDAVAGDLDLKEYVRVHTARLETQRIREALEAVEGNVTHAARALGISRKSLQVKMKEYGLREPIEDAEA